MIYFTFSVFFCTLIKNTVILLLKYFVLILLFRGHFFKVASFNTGDFIVRDPLARSSKKQQVVVATNQKWMIRIGDSRLGEEDQIGWNNLGKVARSIALVFCCFKYTLRHVLKDINFWRVEIFAILFYINFLNFREHQFSQEKLCLKFHQHLFSRRNILR